MKILKNVLENAKCKEFWKAAVIRAWHAVWQAAVPLIPAGITLSQVDWWMVADMSLAAGVLSLIKSLANGVPECSGTEAEEIEDDETVIDESPEIEGEVIDKLTPKEQAEEKALLGNLVPTEKDGE